MGAEGKQRHSMPRFGKGAVEQIKRISIGQPSRFKHAYIVVGGRTAAGYAVEALVANGAKPGQVGLISDLQELPFEGLALTGALLKNGCKLDGHYTCAAASKPAQDAKWYQEHGVEVYTNVTLLSHIPGECLVRSIDFVDFVYTTALIIATGTNARVLNIPHPPAPLPATPPKDAAGGTIHMGRKDACGVFYLDSVREARRLLAALDGGPKRCLVVGGSPNGIEIAATLCELGHTVTLTCNGDSILSSVLPVPTATAFRELLESRGVEIVTDLTCVKFLLRNDRLRACKFHTGEVIDADVAVVATGRQTHLGPFAESLRTQESSGMVCIKVDSTFQTSVPGVYAIGDIAAMPFSQFASSQFQHASHGRASAQFVADVLFADPDKPKPSYDHLPSASYTLFDKTWHLLGETSGDLTITHGSLETKLACLWTWERQLLGILVSGVDSEVLGMLRKLAVDQPIVDDIALRNCADVDAVVEVLRAYA